MVASGVAYVASTLAFTHRMHRTHLDALRLGYENLALLEQVRRERAAERSNLEKSRFLAAASHDLRQPVLAVSLFLGLLTNEKLTAHGRYLVDNIASATAAMGHLFDALLNISRLDAGVIEPRRKWFPQSAAGAVAGRVCAAGGAERLVAAGQAQQGGGEFGSGAAGAHPAQSHQQRHRAYPARRRAGRLPASARRRAHPGLRYRAGHPAVRTGAGVLGVPPAEQPGAGSQQGAGTGLAIVRRTAALLDHPLVLASQEGRGTLFSLGLETRSAEEALAATPPTPEPAPPAPAAGDAIPDHGRGRMVLVVDDDAQNLAGLTLLLEAGATASWAPPAATPCLPRWCTSPSGPP